MDPKQFRQIIKQELASIVKTQAEHTKKINALMAELYQVHQLADGTLDIVKGRYERNKKEINEIKDHLDLPKDPYFSEPS